MKNCIDEGILQAWLDGELPADEAARVAAHLSVCAVCSATVTGAEAESLTLREALSPEFAATVPTERLRARMDTAIAGLQAQATTVSASRWESFTHFFGSFRPLAYASVVAVILVAAIVGFFYLKKPKTTAVIVSNNPPVKSPAPPESPAPVVVQQPHNDTIRSSPSATPRFMVARKSKPAGRTSAEEPDAMSLSWQQRQYEYAIAQLSEALKYQPPMRPALQVEYEYNIAVADSTIAATREAAQKNPKDPLANQFMLAAYQSKVNLMNEIAAARNLQK